MSCQSDRCMRSPVIVDSCLAVIVVGAPSARAQGVTPQIGARVVTYAATARFGSNRSGQPKALVHLGGANGEGPAELSEVLGVARL